MSIKKISMVIVFLFSLNGYGAKINNVVSGDEITSSKMNEIIDSSNEKILYQYREYGLSENTNTAPTQVIPSLQLSKKSTGSPDDEFFYFDGASKSFIVSKKSKIEFTCSITKTTSGVTLTARYGIDGSTIADKVFGSSGAAHHWVNVSTNAVFEVGDKFDCLNYGGMTNGRMIILATSNDF